jgi:hypothetical protein
MEPNIQLLNEYLQKIDEIIVKVETNEQILMLSAAMLQRTIDIYDNLIGPEQRNNILQQIIDGKMAPKENEEVTPE